MATRNHRTHRVTAGLLVIFLLTTFWWSSKPVEADAPERVDAFVYALSVFNGQTYQSAFAPPSADTIYLLEGTENVLAGRLTRIYYWAITNRYEADWYAKNLFVDGTLEIIKNGRVVASIQPTDYVIQYDTNNPLETRHLAQGAEAVTAYERFKQMQKDYKDALYLYYELQQIYRETVDELIASGVTVPESEFPQPPQEPAPVSLYSTEITRGYVVELPEGHYQVQLRLPDGSVQPESRKALRVISQEKSGISYQVMPQTRWTQPTSSKTDGSVIYTTPGTTLYLQPFNEGMYNDLEYAHLVDPQDFSSRADQTRWVTYAPLENGVLEVTSANGQTSQFPVTAYKVIQIAASGLGYEVRRYDRESMGGSPSFEGYQLTLDAVQRSYTIRLLDDSGAEIAGSRREVRTLNTSSAGWLYLLSLLPVFYGIALMINRQKKVKKIQVEE